MFCYTRHKVINRAGLGPPELHGCSTIIPILCPRIKVYRLVILFILWKSYKQKANCFLFVLVIHPTVGYYLCKGLVGYQVIMVTQ